MIVNPLMKTVVESVLSLSFAIIMLMRLDSQPLNQSHDVITVVASYHIVLSV